MWALVELYDHIEEPLLIISDAWETNCIKEIRSRIAMSKSAFLKKRSLLTSRLSLHLWKKLVKCYICNIVFSWSEA